jgi:hypothetical protein
VQNWGSESTCVGSTLTTRVWILSLVKTMSTCQLEELGVTALLGKCGVVHYAISLCNHKSELSSL